MAQGPSLLRRDVCQLAREPVQQAGLLAGQALLPLRDTMSSPGAGKTHGIFTATPNTQTEAQELVLKGSWLPILQCFTTGASQADQRCIDMEGCLTEITERSMPGAGTPNRQPAVMLWAL